MGLAFAEEFSIACCVNAWGAVQGGDFESCVIGETIQSVVFLDITHFLQGIALQCVGCLRDVFMTSDIVQTDHFEALAQNLSHFGELVLVICGKYNLHVLI